VFFTAWKTFLIIPPKFCSPFPLEPKTKWTIGKKKLKEQVAKLSAGQKNFKKDITVLFFADPDGHKSNVFYMEGL
jgi:hypothetical protein